MQLGVPPPPPESPRRPPGLSLLALLLGALALVVALPVLWYRLRTGPVAGSASAEIIGEIARTVQGGTDAGWLGSARATAMLLAFLALVTAFIALILKHSGRLAAIAVVLGLAALTATSLGLTLAVVFGVLLIGVLLLGIGIG